MIPEHFRTLYDYNAWANRRILEACHALTEEQFTRDLGWGFPSVRDTVVHIMSVEWIWLERWHTRSPSALPRGTDFPGLASVRARWPEIEENLLRFVGGLSPEDLVSVREFQTLTLGAAKYPLWQTLQHLVNHSTYHRGQVTTMLRQLGAAPAATDLILYYREWSGKPPDQAIAPEIFRLLYDYNAWANHRVLDPCGALTDEQFTRDLHSSFPSLRDTLVHILGVEWLWLERWQGRSPTALPSAEQFPSLASVRRYEAEIRTNLLRFIAGCTAEHLARPSEYHTTKGVPTSNPLWQSLQHLINHGSYHRGQTAAMLRQLGAVPNSTDLIRFYRDRASTASA